MRNKLPILFAVMLVVVAAMPLLRPREWQRWVLRNQATTVPPPEPAGLHLMAASQTQSPAGGADTSAAMPRVAEASQAAEDPQITQPKPQALLDNAVRSVEGHRFIASHVNMHGEMFNHQITGDGRYFELRDGPIPQIHLELTIQIGTTSASLMQVCNGTTFWTYRKLPDRETLSKIDAYRAVAALTQAAGRVPPGTVAATPGLGGLGRLMRGLNAWFDFPTAIADQLGSEPVWRLEGGWKPGQLARLMPDQKAAMAKGRPPDLTRLPFQLPDRVTLFLGKKDCFPFRIDYLRSVPKSTPRCLMGLEFFELNFNGPIDAGEFLFTPGNLDINDRTEEFVRSVGG